MCSFSLRRRIRAQIGVGMVGWDDYGNLSRVEQGQEVLRYSLTSTRRSLDLETEMFPLQSHNRHRCAAHTGWDQAGLDYPAAGRSGCSGGQEGEVSQSLAGCSVSRDQPTHLLPLSPGARAEEEVPLFSKTALTTCSDLPVPCSG